MSKLDAVSRNILINGGMNFFQRSSSVNLSTNMAYLSADRFRVSYTGTVTGTPLSGSSSDVPSNGKSLKSIFFTSRRNASDQSLIISQRVESLNALACSGEYVSFSSQYKSPVATQAILTIKVPSALDNYAISSIAYTKIITITADSTWREIKDEAILLPNVSNGFEVELKLVLPSGTDASNVTHNLTQLKLNFGRVARSFTTAGSNIAEEDLLCKRYFEKTHVYIYNNDLFSSSVFFRASKRVPPTVTVAVNSNPNGKSIGLTSTPTVDEAVISIGVASQSLYTLDFTTSADAEI